MTTELLTQPPIDAVAVIPPGIPEPFSTYLKMRNGFVARKLGEALARMLGTISTKIDGMLLDITDTAPENGVANPGQLRHSLIGTAGNVLELIQQGFYPMLSGPIHSPETAEINEISTSEFFGSVITKPGIVDKTMLYSYPDRRSSNGELTNNQFPEFKQDIAGIVGEGFSLRTVEDLNAAVQLMLENGHTSLRLKHATATSGHGQISFAINERGLISAQDLFNLYKKNDPDCEFVLMPDLSTIGLEGERIAPRNISLNCFELPGGLGKYIAIGEQIDINTQNANGEVDFGGSKVQIIKIPDSISILPAESGDEERTSIQDYVAGVLTQHLGDSYLNDVVMQQSILNGLEFIQKYFKHMDGIFTGSVFGVDTLSTQEAGVDEQAKVGIVADMRSRIGGTDPALFELLERFIDNPELQHATANVELYYGLEKFVDISGEIVEVMNYVDSDNPNSNKSLQIIVRKF